ncbi:MAG TPA: LuxR C-terminal-related transcriptional regulator [Trebonia sp.]|nr:LuxR C-terminal-related transcriptional regulator [Trebonia sp.]
MGNVQTPPRSQAHQLSLASHRRGQLPADITSFVGRQAELGQLAALLGVARLVTVTGPGGVGKTRLALRAAAQAASRYPDGVVFLDLSAVRHPDLLETLAVTLGLPAPARPASSAGPGELGLDALLGYLSGRRLLLILDTCEHMIDSCATLTGTLLARAAGVTILATSRQPLDVPGEHILALPPLPIPDQEAGGADYGTAVELFTQRAASAVPGFSMTGDNRPAVIKVCQRLDGIPLAIELAALRLRALPIEQLERLADCPDGASGLLTGSRRTTVSRHRTMASSIGWSHGLCTPAEQAAWGRLSVFAGSFDLDAAEAVCADAGLPPGQVTKAVIGLVDKSVLLREPGSWAARQSLPGAPGSVSAGDVGQPASRYWLPHAVRQVGTDRLASAGDGGQAVHERYVAHWTGAAKRFADHVIDDQLTQYRAIRGERDNIRAAYRRALRLADASQPAARLAVALTMSWMIGADLREGRGCLGRAIARGHQPTSPLARALASRALLAATAGDLPAALADAEASVTMGAKVGDLVAQGRGYVARHRAATRGGDWTGAAQATAAGIPLLEEAGDVLGLVLMDIQSAGACLPADPTACAEIRDRGLRRLPPDELWASSRLIGLTVSMLYLEGDYLAASESARTALAMSHQLGDIMGVADGLGFLGVLAGAQGHHTRAASLIGAASPLWRHAGVRYSGHPMTENLHRVTVRAARDALGGDRYTRVRDAGSARRLEEAIALATVSLTEPDLEFLPTETAAGPAPWPAPPPTGKEQASLDAVMPQDTSAADPLTSRETQIAALVASGLSNREIAERMVISKRTVDAHVDHIFSKLGISSRVQLTVWLRDRIPQARASHEQPEPVSWGY